eukprot:g13661.t1
MRKPMRQALFPALAALAFAALLAIASPAAAEAGGAPCWSAEDARAAALIWNPTARLEERLAGPEADALIALFNRTPPATAYRADAIEPAPNASAPSSPAPSSPASAPPAPAPPARPAAPPREPAPPRRGAVKAEPGGPVDVLARTIWGEARGEPTQGREAVAAVVLNRVAKAQARGGHWWGDDVVGVCQAPWQFSCWNEGDPNREKLLAVDETDRAFRECLQIASRAVAGELADPTDGATHYHHERIGLPLLVKAVGGALGSSSNPVAKAAGEALGAVEAEIRAGGLTAEDLAEANRHLEAMAGIEAETDRTWLREVNQTIRTEIASDDWYVRRMRPTFGYVVAVTWAAQMGAVAYIIATNPAAAGAVVSALGQLGTIWTVGLSVLGIYVYKRSQEKTAPLRRGAPAEAAGGALADLLGRITGRPPAAR